MLLEAFEFVFFKRLNKNFAIYLEFLNDCDKVNMSANKTRGCVMGCTGYSRTFGTNNPDSMNMWAQLLGLPKLLKSHRVCEKHFSEGMFTNKDKTRLTRTAIPYFHVNDPSSKYGVIDDFDMDTQAIPKCSHQTLEIDIIIEETPQCSPKGSDEEEVKFEEKPACLDRNVGQENISIPRVSDASTSTAPFLRNNIRKKNYLKKILRTTKKKFKISRDQVCELKKIIEVKDQEIARLRKLVEDESERKNVA